MTITKVDTELARVLLKLIEESGDTLQGEAATRIYSLISSITGERSESDDQPQEP